MEKRDYIIILYDFYGDLLNEKQREYFENYYFNNLSLSEISDNLKISRNAVHKMIKGAENKLIEYEEKLSLYRKNNQLKSLIKEIDDKKIKLELEKLL